MSLATLLDLPEGGKYRIDTWLEGTNLLKLPAGGGGGGGTLLLLLALLLP